MIRCFKVIPTKLIGVFYITKLSEVFIQTCDPNTSFLSYIQYGNWYRRMSVLLNSSCGSHGHQTSAIRLLSGASQDLGVRDNY
jgi:hypothetical protein